jgi:hypothetical protein
MSSQDPIGSSVPPERPANPTHFGGTGLYEGAADKAGNGEDAESLKVPLSDHLSSTAQESPESGQGSQAAPQDTIKRYNVLTWIAVGGIVCLLTALVRRSTSRT